jgi:hypothetical protein
MAFAIPGIIEMCELSALEAAMAAQIGIGVGALVGAGIVVMEANAENARNRLVKKALDKAKEQATERVKEKATEKAKEKAKEKPKEKEPERKPRSEHRPGFRVPSNTRKEAEERARQAGGGKPPIGPEKHDKYPPHYHPGVPNKDPRRHDHYTFPRRYF